jgi:hypothetical protein
MYLRHRHSAGFTRLAREAMESPDLPWAKACYHMFCANWSLLTGEPPEKGAEKIRRFWR